LSQALEGTGLIRHSQAKETQKKEWKDSTSRIDHIKTINAFGIYGPVRSRFGLTFFLELGFAAIGLGREFFVLHKKGTPLPEALKFL